MSTHTPFCPKIHKKCHSRFAALLAHVPRALRCASRVLALVQLERPLPAEAALAVRTPERLLRVRQMRLPVRLEEARPRHHIAARLAAERVRLQVPGHVHNDGRIAAERGFAAAHVAAPLVLAVVVVEQRAQRPEARILGPQLFGARVAQLEGGRTQFAAEVVEAGTGGRV